ncbi:hypothetical protein [Nocardioides sp. WS12]|uniref:hypothetical protein n=1 Tax=Nocardioides sp. WS12 TaxID=2486272 RepID=UPI0015FD7DB5|nr:hypothetical protein [Nocardioides sp. WS12]
MTSAPADEADAPVGLALDGTLHSEVHARLHEILGDVDPRRLERAADALVALFAGWHGAASHLAGEELLDAVRHYRDDEWLAACPLSQVGDGDLATRLRVVRRLIRDQVDACFGTSSSERLLHATFVRGYFDAAGHQSAHRDLHMSRSTYYRTLRRGRVRLLTLTGQAL